MNRAELRALLLGALLLLLPAQARADLALSVTGGTFVDDGCNHDWSATLWHVFDQMVLVGVTSGVQIDGEDNQIPLLASLFVRLPIGRQLLPVATGDWGWLFGDGADEPVWRVGGGLDLKLGDRSSLLLLGGAQMGTEELSTRPNLRGGLILEF